ncbi:hypothetical protein B0T26DRAFT_776826 [Lasiosphaeria miniovina]|uniref:Zn(2)-C6 fungal-type domain-containing protein n=1 Tax=Lasiosphaeria miniovina TaxID=1954250 RepID=A0AA40AL23_9PEZI|nr:uncharacterized protein B0T26DRAFT_776826 [Lasiosphaeria miniovina]KAK0717836.1 hypothetical protein B0T26DRAFT_776826 [Lasiosphaeria miniovina]
MKTTRIHSSSSQTCRQRPGFACEECRKRKVGCDRKQPQCGKCIDAGVKCVVDSNRPARGPKKGSLKTLQNGVGELLPKSNANAHSFSESGFSPYIAKALLTHPLFGDPDTPVTDETLSASTSPPPEGANSQFPSPCEQMMFWDNELRLQIPPSTLGLASLPLFPCQFPPSPPLPPECRLIDELMAADLDQLYFDRVHPNYAMWTLAMAHSSQFESSRDQLYGEKRRMLGGLDFSQNDMGVVHIEHVQAWLLIALYEFARTNYRRGWVSAGRAFRLVQLTRLHEVDSPDNMIEGEDPVLAEEKRRTFWVAYCLDRFIGIRRRWQLTLVEDVIFARFSSPELSFQAGHPTQTCFLSQAMGARSQSTLSPLAECSILVTICENALSHHEQSMIESTFGSMPSDAQFWLRHDWLSCMLSKSLESLDVNYPGMAGVTDPLLLFTSMMAHSVVIYLCQIMEASGMQSHYSPTVDEFQNRAMIAAREIARFARAHEHIGYFKAHIFLPVVVFLGASRLISHRTTHQYEIESCVEAELQSCKNTLQKLQSSNNLAWGHLYVLESQHFTSDYVQVCI